MKHYFNYKGTKNKNKTKKRQKNWLKIIPLVQYQPYPAGPIP